MTAARALPLVVIGDSFVQMQRGCRRGHCFELFQGTYRGDGAIAVHTWRCIESNRFLTLRSPEEGFRMENEWEAGTCINVSESEEDARQAHAEMVNRLDAALLARIARVSPEDEDAEQ